MTNLLVIFVVLNIVNVIFQTLKTILTVKGNKWIAASINALTFGLYTVVIVYTVCELPLWEKVVIVALCNFIGVFTVKVIEEKLRKDKLWKIETTVHEYEHEQVEAIAKLQELNFSNYQLGNTDYAFNFYCKTQADTQKVTNILKTFDCPYIVLENRSSLS